MGYQAIIKTPLPELLLGLKLNLTHATVEGIEFVIGQQQTFCQSEPFTKHVVCQIEAYFSDPTKKIALPITIKGTEYQQKVWQALKAIPCGRVLTYGQLAAELKSSPRAVGAACRTNPVPLIVPCHRVVAKTGYGGYAGDVTGVFARFKRWLLAHEGFVRG